MALSEVKIRKSKPKDKNYKITDEKGLFLQVTIKGSKYWRFKYRFNGKEKLLAIGVYPDLSLKEARIKRDEARNLLANDIDPSEHKKQMRKATRLHETESFEAIAKEWFVKHQATWSPRHADNVIRRLERNIFPWIGDKLIFEISAQELLSVIQRIENRGAIETAHRVCGSCSQIFSYAIYTGRAERNIADDIRRGLSPVKSSHLNALIDPQELAKVLRIIDDYNGTLIVKCALQLLPLVFTRPGELRHAQWEDIDLSAAEWRFTVSKTNTPHIVPLSAQAIEILNEIKPLTGDGKYVFPSARSNTRPISDNAMLAAMRTMGITKEQTCSHGFRASARTLIAEKLKYRSELIEQQLAHAVRDPNGRAYNRTAFLDERREMMQRWAGYLDELKQSEGKNV